MKKIILLSSIIFIPITKIFSQPTDIGYVAIGFGAAIPSGDFGSKDMNSPTSGLATSGAFFDISLAYKFGTNFGLAALVRGQSNGVENEILVKQFNQTYQPHGITGFVKANNWKSNCYMIGGYGSFPVSSRTNFEVRALGGFMSANSPEINYDLSSTNGGRGWMKQGSASSLEFAYLFGGGLRFFISERISFLGKVDYTQAKHEFKNVLITSNFAAASTHSFSQKIGTVNIGIGICLALSDNSETQRKSMSK